MKESSLRFITWSASFCKSAGRFPMFIGAIG
jgi:hypothetical protein